MREGAFRLAATVLLVVFLFTGTGEKTENREDPDITVSGLSHQDQIDIDIRSATAKRQTEGGYLVAVEFTTHAEKQLMGMRMVTVFCGEQKQGFPLTQENLDEIHRVCIAVQDQPGTVRVEVRAHQTEGALMLISDGEGHLCGEAAAPVDGDRWLRLSGARPCGAYDIYRIAGLSELFSGMVALSERPTVKEQEAYAVPDRYALTLTAEADGSLLCNATRQGLGDGIYLAVGQGEYFYFCLPWVEASGQLISSVSCICLE